MVFASGVSSGGCSVAGCGNAVCARGLCRKHYQRWYRTGSVRPLERARRCLVCGGWFVLNRSHKVFCSNACELRWLRLDRKGMAPRRVPTPIREDRPQFEERPPVVKEGFTLEDVWARFDGVCRLCGRRVDRDVSPWLPEAGVPSWVLPLEVGGEFSLENRTIVHRSCLSRKGSGGASDGRKGRNAGDHGGKRKKGVEGR